MALHAMGVVRSLLIPRLWRAACLAVALLCTGNAEAGDDLADRSLYEIEQDIRAVTRREASAPDLIERGRAIEQMAKLYGSILQDPRYATSPILQRYRARLWGRLRVVQRSLRREMVGWRKQVADADAPRAQRSAEQLETELAAARALTTSMDLLASTQGGPARLIPYDRPSHGPVPLGGAARLDYGQALVELIERTIDPDFWQVQGGPGVIVYYPPLFALVVSATEEVHEKIGGVVGGLR